MGKFTRRQWTYLVLLYMCNLSVFAAIALLPPFYPALAQSKGASATQFGFVFGIFRLTMGLVSPIYGKYLEKLGVKYLLSTGVFTVAVTSTLMGILSMVHGTQIFIGLSFAVQIASALGAAGLTNVNVVTANKEFPNCSNSVFASIEAALGLGNMTGPLIGGYLFEWGGYTLPFVVVGGVLFFVSMSVAVFLPPDEQHSSSNEEPSKLTVLQVISEPSIALYIYNLIAACYGYGFFLGTLEYHLSTLGLLPLEIGYQFVLLSAIFTLSAWGWGWLCDTKSCSLSVTFAGSLLQFLAFLIMGPAPFINLPFTLLLVMIANFLLGVGNSAQVMATFSGVYQEAVNCGFPEIISTYGLIGGIWNCCFSMGCFIGFSVGGMLLDMVGFKWASMVVVILQMISISNIFMYICYKASVHYKDDDSEDTSIKTNSSKKHYGSFGKPKRNIRRRSTLKVLLEHDN